MEEMIKKAYGDQFGGKFPVTGLDGSNYLLMVYDYSTDYMHIETMKSKSAEEYKDAYAKAISFFEAHGVTITKIVVDNETSETMEEFWRKKKIKYEYVPPYMHSANIAEKMIDTAKRTLICMMIGTDPDAPLQLWNHYVSQLIIILNSIRASRTKPEISAYHHMHGEAFDIDKHPMAPVGTLVITHAPPEKRQPFAPHGTAAYYVGPAITSYRCFEVWVSITKRIRTTNTVSWHPKGFSMPYSTSEEILTEAFNNLSNAIKMVHIPKNENNKNLSELGHRLTDNMKELFQHISGDRQEEGPTIDSQTSPLQHPFVLIHKTKKTKDDDIETTANASIERVEITPTEPSERVPAEETRTKSKSSGAAKRSKKKGKIVAWSRLTLQYIEDAKAVGSDEALTRYKENLKALPTKLFDPQQSKKRDNSFVHPPAPLNFEKCKQTPAAKHWWQASDEEWVRLAELYKTIQFIKFNQKPTDKKAMYYNPRPSQKVNEDGTLAYRIRGTVGGNLQEYEGITAAHTAGMEAVKILLNSTISTPGAKFCTMDLSNFYLNSTLDTPEYMKVHRRQISDNIIQKYNLQDDFVGDFLMVKIIGGIYGLKNAGILAQKQLVKLLNESGYYAETDTPCIFNHKDNKDITFTLTVDDFGIKYTHVTSRQHLLETLQKKYVVTTNYKGDEHIGLKITWDYPNGKFTTQIPGYIHALLKRLDLTNLPGAESACIYTPPSYGTKGAQMSNETTYEPCTDAEKLLIQRASGALLYYSAATDATMGPAVAKLSCSGFNTNSVTLLMRLLNFASRYQDAITTYYASNMQLSITADASYQSEPQSRSRLGGCFKLGTDTKQGYFATISKIIENVCGSVGEAEYGSLFKNAQKAVGYKTILEAIGHKQDTTVIKTDNKCAEGLANNTIKQKHSKSVEKAFHWLRQQVELKRFSVIWEKGSTNEADFFTKSLPVHAFKTRQHQLVSYSPSDKPNDTARSRRVTSKINKAAQATEATTSDMMLDSGSTKTFVSSEDKRFIKRIIKSKRRMQIKVANDEIVHSDSEGLLHLPLLPLAATKAHIVPSFKASLLSVASMVNAGLEVTFRWADVLISNGRDIVMRGTRNRESGLWYVPISTPTS